MDLDNNTVDNNNNNEIQSPNDNGEQAPQNPLFEKVYDIDDFIGDSKLVVKEYICTLCSGIYNDPNLSSCGHIFCKPCITKQSETSGFCPIDNSKIELEQIIGVKFIKDMLEKQRIYCKNRSKGCEWDGQFLNLAHHMEIICDYRIVRCENSSCSFEGEKYLMDSHSRNCPYRIYSCDYCKKDLKMNAKEKHEQECEMKIFECENKCGARITKAEKLVHKTSYCSERFLSCSFEHVGCKKQFKRKEQDEHMKEYCLQHLNYINELILKMKNPNYFANAFANTSNHKAPFNNNGNYREMENYYGKPSCPNDNAIFEVHNANNENKSISNFKNNFTEKSKNKDAFNNFDINAIMPDKTQSNSYNNTDQTKKNYYAINKTKNNEKYPTRKNLESEKEADKRKYEKKNNNIPKDVSISKTKVKIETAHEKKLNSNANSNSKANEHKKDNDKDNAKNKSKKKLLNKESISSSSSSSSSSENSEDDKKGKSKKLNNEKKKVSDIATRWQQMKKKQNIQKKNYKETSDSPSSDSDQSSDSNLDGKEKSNNKSALKNKSKIFSSNKTKQENENNKDNTEKKKLFKDIDLSLNLTDKDGLDGSNSKEERSKQQSKLKSSKKDQIPDIDSFNPDKEDTKNSLTLLNKKREPSRSATDLDELLTKELSDNKYKNKAKKAEISLELDLLNPNNNNQAESTSENYQGQEEKPESTPTNESDIFNLENNTNKDEIINLEDQEPVSPSGHEDINCLFLDDNIFDKKNISGDLEISANSVKNVSPLKFLPQHKFIFVNSFLNEKSARWKVILKTHNSWAAVGVCVKEVVIKNNYKFLNSVPNKVDEYGFWGLSSNGFSWSNNNDENNKKSEALKFSSEQKIVFTYDLIAKTLLLEVNKEKLILSNVKPEENTTLVPCILFSKSEDSATYIPLEN